jgi:hypothetical protein
VMINYWCFWLFYDWGFEVILIRYFFDLLVHLFNIPISLYRIMNTFININFEFLLLFNIPCPQFRLSSQSLCSILLWSSSLDNWWLLLEVI